MLRTTRGLDCAFIILATQVLEVNALTFGGNSVGKIIKNRVVEIASEYIITNVYADMGGSFNGKRKLSIIYKKLLTMPYKIWTSFACNAY